MDKIETLYYDANLINVIYIEKYDYANAIRKEKRSSSFSEVYYFLEGNGEVIIEGEKIKIEKDHVLLVNPNIDYDFISTDLKSISFSIQGLNLKEDAYKILEGEDILELKDYFTLIYRAYTGRSTNKAFLLTKLIEIILKEVGGYCTLELNLFHNNPHEKARLRKIKDYLDTNAREDINLDLLSKRFKINKYYLVHEFKDTYGISPITYLVNARIKLCKEYLANTDLSIQEISDTLNYSSQSYFSQIFKKNTGLSPNEFRKLSKGKNK